MAAARQTAQMSAAKEVIATINEVDALRVQLRQIYNTYRTALLNRKYYGHKLSRYQDYNFYTEIAIAIGATGSGGIAGLAIWGTITGKFAWLTISGGATVLSVIKPVLQFGKQIEKYTKLNTGHTSIYLELKAIVEDIERSRSVPRKLEDKYSSIRLLIKELGGLDDPRQNDVLIRSLQSKVNEEIRPEDLWMP